MTELKKQLRTWIDLVSLLVVRDLRVRYRGSFLGYLWSMMNPLLYMIVLSFVFSHIMKFQIEHYPVFVLSGILTWNLFHQSVGSGVHSVVNNGALLRKVRVPESIFPAASVCSMLVNFLLALIPFAIIATATGVKLTPWVLLVPLLLVPYVLFIFGASLFFSTLNVRFRDVGHVMEPLLQITFYATPVVYPESTLPESYRRLIELNPLTHFLRGFRSVLFYGEAPSWSSVVPTIAIALVMLLIGGSLFYSRRDRFVYDL